MINVCTVNELTSDINDVQFAADMIRMYNAHGSGLYQFDYVDAAWISFIDHQYAVDVLAAHVTITEQAMQYVWLT